MGKKDDQLTSKSTLSAEKLQDRLFGLGAIRLKKMFGGYGVFEEDTMFALVDSQGVIFFKADDTNVASFEDANSKKHARMPYYQVPDAVLEDENTLLEWAQTSILVARKAKKK
jgi:DNA transformation protein